MPLSSLTKEFVKALRNPGMNFDTWVVNDEQSLEISAKLGISRICTDYFKQALVFEIKCLKVMVERPGNKKEHRQTQTRGLIRTNQIT